MASPPQYSWNEVFAQMNEDDERKELQEKFLGHLSFDSAALEDFDDKKLNQFYKIILYHVETGEAESYGFRQLIAEPLKKNLPWILCAWDWNEENLDGVKIVLATYTYTTYEEIFDDASLISVLQNAAFGLRENRAEKHFRSLIAPADQPKQKPRV